MRLSPLTILLLSAICVAMLVGFVLLGIQYHQNNGLSGSLHQSKDGFVSITINSNHPHLSLQQDEAAINTLTHLLDMKIAHVQETLKYNYREKASEVRHIQIQFTDAVYQNKLSNAYTLTTSTSAQADTITINVGLGEKISLPAVNGKTQFLNYVTVKLLLDLLSNDTNKPNTEKYLQLSQKLLAKDMIIDPKKANFFVVNNVSW